MLFLECHLHLLLVVLQHGKDKVNLSNTWASKFTSKVQWNRRIVFANDVSISIISSTVETNNEWETIEKAPEAIVELSSSMARQKAAWTLREHGVD